MTAYVAVSLTFVFALVSLLVVRRVIGLRFASIFLGAAVMVLVSIVGPPILAYALRPLGLGYHGGLFVLTVIGAPFVEETARAAFLALMLACLGRNDFVGVAASFGLGWGVIELVGRDLPALAAVAGQPYLWAATPDKMMLAGPPMYAVWLTVARGAVVVWHVTFALLAARALLTRKVRFWLAALASHALFNAASLIFETRFGWDAACVSNLVCAGIALFVAARLINGRASAASIGAPA